MIYRRLVRSQATKASRSSPWGLRRVGSGDYTPSLLCQRSISSRSAASSINTTTRWLAGQLDLNCRVQTCTSPSTMFNSTSTRAYSSITLETSKEAPLERETRWKTSGHEKGAGKIETCWAKRPRAIRFSWVDDTPLPINLSGAFLTFLMHNKLPNGRVNPLPSLTPDEYALLLKPFNQWAPAPFNNRSIPQESAAILFLSAFGGLEELFAFGRIIAGGRFEGIPMLTYDLSFLKQRAWGGLVPLSNRRWEEKKLDQSDETKTFLKALDYLESIYVFLAINLPGELVRMGRAYNRVYDHLARFDEALAAYRAQRPQTKDPSSQGKAAELWAEFFFSRVEYMLARTRQWYMSHANTMYAQVLRELQTRPPQQPGEEDMVIRRLMMLLKHRIEAEITFQLPLHGLKNPLFHWKLQCNPPIIDWEEHVRSAGKLPIPQGIFPDAMLYRETVFTNRYFHFFNERTKSTGRDGLEAHRWDPSETARKAAVAWAALDQVSSEMQPASAMATPITEELWITQLKPYLSEYPPDRAATKYTHWGFVAYRLDYSHSEAEWEAFLDKFNSDTAAWSSMHGNVLGAEQVKDSCKIIWINGNDYGIPEGDVATARSHYKSLCDSKSPLIEGLLTPPDFLVADSFCINSYIKYSRPGAHEHADSADFLPEIVVAQSGELDTAKIAHLDKHGAPGYNGAVLVACSALFEDVFPALFMNLYQLADLWPVAVNHPGTVYLGAPLAGYQVNGWFKFRMELYKVLQEQQQIPGPWKGEKDSPLGAWVSKISGGKN
ncbi:hypothetical protein QBC37DRAFT_391477 [Rhypophila decipiens]|uniref:Uncharacterized protein n=1 Tax=Rhypophila decipiens TaxID=261697 RepID=A0AAN7B5R8_9PEZI|nr:hypothetical protein QBC37DRAFT_391477 [Rhypophila decipiens]